jgi:hemoglobin
MSMKLFAVAALVAGLAGCSQMEAKPVAKAPLKDGDLAMPDYKSWPVFLKGIERADLKQIRDIYVNPVGAKTKAGQAFPNGTLFVMELYGATPGPDGKLVKGKLSKVFLMGKGEGWGSTAPENLGNGDWIYTAYGADGVKGAADSSSCRACHLPLVKEDFVFRYQEYFDKRAGLSDNPLAALGAEQIALANRLPN